MVRPKPETILANLVRVLEDPKIGISYRGRSHLNRLGRLRAEFIAQIEFQLEMREKIEAAERRERKYEQLMEGIERRERQRAMIRHYDQQRRARELGLSIRDLTPEQWERIKVAWGQRCAYCGIYSDNLTLDHMYPVSRGGNHTAANIVPACKSCNSKKHKGRMLPFAVTPDEALLPAPLIIPPDELFEDDDDSSPERSA